MNSTTTIGSNRQASKAHLAFLAFVLISSIAFWKTMSAWFAFSIRNESGSHIVLIPLVTAFLIFRRRQEIFSTLQPSFAAGIPVILAGAILYWSAMHGALSEQLDVSLSVATFAILLIWVGGFLSLYGVAAARAAGFPLTFLVLMIPLPNRVLDWAIRLLQEGSTQVAYSLFNVLGVPVFRHGFLLSVPTVTIEVATECSGIRSSIALFITCLLAAHLYLRSPWKILLFTLLVFPVAVLKNGARIVTLTLLAVYVDPGFLQGSLHQRGGYVFFLLTLLLLYPVFILLEKSESKHGAVSAFPPEMGSARE